MQRRTFLRRARPGYLLLEALLGIMIFSLFLAATGLVLLNGQEETVAGGDRVRATFFAERSLEAARAVRENSGFGNLNGAMKGVGLVAGMWLPSNIPTVDSGGYITELTINSLDAGTKKIVAKTSWRYGRSPRSGSLLIATDLTDWRGTRPTGDWRSPGSYATVAHFTTSVPTDVAIAGNAAYVTTSASPGLYVFSIANPASPVRVSASFTLGAGARAVRTRGNVLYVLTTLPSAELEAFDITDPTAMAGTPLATVDLPGSARGWSLGIAGDTLYAGASTDATEKQFYAFSIANPATIVSLGSAKGSADVLGIAVTGTSAYLATANISAELGVVDVRNPSLPAYVANEGYDVASNMRGNAIAVSGSSAILGQQKGGTSDKNVCLFSMPNGGIPTTTPVQHQASGSVVDLDVDAGGCYAFLAAQTSKKGLQILNMRTPTLAEVGFYNLTTPASAVAYDAVRDLLFLLTQDSLLILSPAASTGTCP